MNKETELRIRFLKDRLKTIILNRELPKNKALILLFIHTLSELGYSFLGIDNDRIFLITKRNEDVYLLTEEINESNMQLIYNQLNK